MHSIAQQYCRKSPEQISIKLALAVYCKSTNFGVLLYLANLANFVFLLIIVAPTYVNYVDRTLHKGGDSKFNSRQITLF